MQQTITLSDLISQDILQELQDAFSRCVGTAALITDASGTPLTRGSGYSPFCGLTRHSSLGCERCAESDIEGGPHAITSGEVSVYHCKMGLLDFAAPIKVGSECIGALVGGQVRTGPVDEARVRELAELFGIDPEVYLQAARDTKEVSEEQVARTVQFLADICSVLSKLAYQKYLLMIENRKMQADADIQRKLVHRLNTRVGEIIRNMNAQAYETPGAQTDLSGRLTDLLKETTAEGTLVEDALAVSGQADESADLVEVPYEIASLMANMVKRCVSGEAGTADRIRLSFHKTIPGYLFGDPEKIGLIVRRLIQVGLNRGPGVMIDIHVDTVKESYATMLNMRFMYRGFATDEKRLAAFLDMLHGKDVPILKEYRFDLLAADTIARTVRRLSGRVRTEKTEEDDLCVLLSIPQLSTKEYEY